MRCAHLSRRLSECCAPHVHQMPPLHLAALAVSGFPIDAQLSSRLPASSCSTPSIQHADTHALHSCLHVWAMNYTHTSPTSFSIHWFLATALSLSLSLSLSPPIPNLFCLSPRLAKPTRVCTCALTHTHTHAHIHAHAKHTQIHVRPCACPHSHTHTSNTHTHTHMQTHIHAYA